MKKRVLSFIACLTCLTFCLSPLCVLALPEWALLIADTIFSEFIAAANERDEDGNRKGFAGVARDVQSDLWEGSFLNPITVNGDISFKIPNYDIVSGKYQFHYTTGSTSADGTVSDSITEDILIECTVLMSDKPDWLASEGYAIRTNNDTGVRLFGNALNISITYSQFPGTERYVVVYRNFNYVNRATMSANTYTISAGYADIYQYSGGQLGQPLFTNYYVNAVTFTTYPVNSISVDINSTVNTPSGYFPTPKGFYSAYSNGSVATSPGLSYPVVQDFVRGGLLMSFVKYNSSGNAQYVGVAVNSLSYFRTSFIETNNPTSANRLNERNELYQQNYYIDNSYVGGTTINSNNYNDYGGGSFGLPFSLPDIDLTDIPWADLLDLLSDLLPDFSTSIKPTLDMNMDDLFDRLFDFYSEMPAIDMQWDPTLDNDNYWEVDIPDSGGGSGGGTVSPWEPPEYPPVNTQPFIPAAYPELSTTYTFPAGYLEGTGRMLNDGWNMADTIGVTAILVPSIIILLLWRFTGK